MVREAEARKEVGKFLEKTREMKREKKNKE